MERDVRSCQGGAKRLAFSVRADAKEIQEITQATVYRTDAEPVCVIDEFCHANVVVAHPEAFGNVGYSAAIFGVAETVEDGALEVAAQTITKHIRWPIFRFSWKWRGSSTRQVTVGKLSFR